MCFHKLFILMYAIGCRDCPTLLHNAKLPSIKLSLWVQSLHLFCFFVVIVPTNTSDVWYCWCLTFAVFNHLQHSCRHVSLVTLTYVTSSCFHLWSITICITQNLVNMFIIYAILTHWACVPKSFGLCLHLFLFNLPILCSVVTWIVCFCVFSCPLTVPVVFI